MNQFKFNRVSETGHLRDWVSRCDLKGQMLTYASFYASDLRIQPLTPTANSHLRLRRFANYSAIGTGARVVYWRLV